MVMNLYLFKDDSQDGNIYVTHFVNGRWNPMKKLNENINTKYYETHASVSRDGRKLYFTSNRKGGFGDQDIYVSDRTSDDHWGPAVNLGGVINTKPVLTRVKLLNWRNRSIAHGGLLSSELILRNLWQNRLLML